MTTSSTGLVEAEGLRKTYKSDVVALDGLTFSVAAGSVYALLGPNGAGKTTTVRILTTLSRPDEGSARVAGIDVLKRPGQVRSVIGSGSLYGMRGKDLRRRAGDLLDQFGLTEAAKRQARTYSGGMRRRLDIATMLVHRPAVLFLDEPTTGLDPEGRAALWEVLTDLAAEAGTTILVTTHYLEEADQYATKIAIVDQGRIVAEGPADAGRRLPAPRRPLVPPSRKDHAVMTTDHSLTMPERRQTGSRPGAVGHEHDRADTERQGSERRRAGTGGLAGTGHRAGPVRQAWVILTARYLRQLYRVPVVIFMTLIQPVIWLLLFGALFKKVAEIPGFGGGNYVTYLTPGVVIMTAIFSASWTGMAYIEDMQNGVMDRFLTAPVSRGAMTMSMLGDQGLTTLLQSAIIIAIGWGIGATFPGGAAGIAALIGVSVLIAVAMASISNWFALLTRQREALIGASATLVLPLTFLSGAFLSLRLVPGWIADIARYNPVNWAASAGRIAVEQHPAWMTVGAYTGFLALAVAITATAAIRAFRTYQRSL